MEAVQVNSGLDPLKRMRERLGDVRAHRTRRLEGRYPSEVQPLVDDLNALLEERDFVHRRSGSSLPGEREYVIKHAVTREVAYESQPRATRAHRHAAFASWLEGAGLGLALVGQIARLHGGDAVAAPRPKEPSCFLVSLPALNA